MTRASRTCALSPAFLALAWVALAPSAAAESCTKSRDYILTKGDLSKPAPIYYGLFKTCLETLTLSNMKDAFILNDGGVAAVPNNDALAATAGTLAEFCTRFPRATLHFVGHAELRQAENIARAVRISSATATSCATITGGGK
jgi:hypothetical protein